MPRTPTKQPDNKASETATTHKKTGIIGKLFLVDSVRSNLNRSKRLVSIYGKNSTNMTLWMLKSIKDQPRKADNIQEVRKTVYRAASGMVASFFVTIFFAGFGAWQLIGNKPVAAAILACVTICYALRFFASTIVWFRAKNELIKQGAW